MKTRTKAVDAAISYLASRKALHKLATPIQVIGTDVAITRAALGHGAAPVRRVRLTRLFHFSLI